MNDNTDNKYTIPFEKIIEKAKTLPALTPEEKVAWKERLRLEDLYIEKFSDNIFAAFHNSDVTDEEICRDLRKCLETNTDWWTLHGEVYQDDVDY